MENKEFICSICEKRTSCKSNLNRHVKNVHTLKKKNEESSVSSRFLCPLENCNEKFRRDAYLREHLKEHGVDVDVQHLEFNTESDYEEWLYSVQNETVSEYVKDCSTKTLASGYKKDYLYCNRSYKSRCVTSNQRKRNFKSQGSKKTGVSCPSRIEVSRKDGEKILVTHWITHCGHSNDLGHLRLDKRSRNKIAAKLMSGVQFEKVLDDVRNGEEAGQNKRLKLLERQDLHNIVRDFSKDFRKGLGTDTNNHLEAYHKNLKHIYLDGKKIKRLDKTSHAVLNITRDSLFKRVIKLNLTKKSSDHNNLRIYKSHKKSDDIQSPIKNKRLVEKAHLIANLLQEGKFDENVTNTMEKQLDNLIGLANSSKSSDPSCKSVKQINSSEKVVKLIRFFSTKKKGSLIKLVKKPTNNEKKNLLNENAEKIYIHTENDHSYCKYQE